MAAGVATYRSDYRVLEVVIRHWEGLQERRLQCNLVMIMLKASFCGSFGFGRQVIRVEREALSWCLQCSQTRGRIWPME